VALNKIDRIYGWKATPDNPVRASLAAQDEATLTQFQNRVKQTRLELNKQGLNAELYFENDSLEDTVSMVPTSAHTGEGIQDLLLMVMQFSQEMLTQRIMCVVHLSIAFQSWVLRVGADTLLLRADDKDGVSRLS
jgi:translation initiation factor 5B